MNWRNEYEEETGFTAYDFSGMPKDVYVEWLEKKLDQQLKDSQVDTIVNSQTTHNLKTLPEYFERIWSGEKNFEVRKNDRGFQKGDKVILKEYNASKITTLDRHKYTGREIHADIGFVLSEYQKQGYVTFSLLNIECI